ncbi:MAG: hypothetical protein JWQ76_5228 [Ramlibacter sp.]|nr:hypothetical protein [Ramlibacter sp.]
MALKKLLVALSSLAAFAAIAQPALGTVSNVQGVVTATQGATGTVVAPGSAVVNGMRFVTTSSGTVTLTLNNGCVVTLQPGQAVTVLQSMTCQQLAAAVVAVPVAPVQAIAGTPIAVTGFLLAVGLGTLYEAVHNDENLSPN